MDVEALVAEVQTALHRSADLRMRLSDWLRILLESRCESQLLRLAAPVLPLLQGVQLRQSVAASRQALERLFRQLDRLEQQVAPQLQLRALGLRATARGIRRDLRRHAELGCPSQSVEVALERSRRRLTSLQAALHQALYVLQNPPSG